MLFAGMCLLTLLQVEWNPCQHMLIVIIATTTTTTIAAVAAIIIIVIIIFKNILKFIIL